MCIVDSYTTNSILRETIFLDPNSEVRKCFDHHWMRCNDSWLRSSHYNVSQWYTSND
jgi:hypothetical protein